MGFDHDGKGNVIVRNEYSGRSLDEHTVVGAQLIMILGGT